MHDQPHPGPMFSCLQSSAAVLSISSQNSAQNRETAMDALPFLHACERARDSPATEDRPYHCLPTAGRGRGLMMEPGTVVVPTGLAGNLIAGDQEPPSNLPLVSADQATQAPRACACPTNHPTKKGIDNGPEGYRPGGGLPRGLWVAIVRTVGGTWSCGGWQIGTRQRS
jgi:hypothetical protein